MKEGRKRRMEGSKQGRKEGSRKGRVATKISNGDDGIENREYKKRR